MTAQLKTFEVTAYRWERYVTNTTVEAASLDAAFAKAQEMDQAGDFDFADYTGEAESADHYIIESDDGLEHTLELPGLVQPDSVIPLLERAESFMSGFEGDESQEGLDSLLADIRALLKKAGA